MKITGFGIGNYRSFGSTGAFLPATGKINVLIGKNNCGKSNVLRFLKLIARSDQIEKVKLGAIDRHRGSNDSLRIGLEFKFDDEIPAPKLEAAFGSTVPRLQVWTNPTGNVVIGDNPLAALDARTLAAAFESLSGRRFARVPSDEQALKEATQAVITAARQAFVQWATPLIYIPAIREIRFDSNTESDPSELSGRNIVRELRSMQHPLIGQESRKREFDAVQTFARELLGTSDLVVEVPADADDIYLNMHGVRLPLSSFGTGIHELIIICSALASHRSHVVCIEEPELHLHPELLRKFLRFLHRTDNRYFITTHSNVFLDDDASVTVYHVRYDGECSTVERKRTNAHSRAILRDLSYRASDLLQSNGIIWVEGPSDRIYIKRWLTLFGSTFVEGIHYSIMFYGGALLAHLTAADGLGDDFIELLQINRHAFVVIDRDGASSKAALKSYKQRIQQEIGEDHCWVTQGREIENYLRPELLEKFFEEKCKGRVAGFTFGADDRIQDAIGHAVSGRKPNYDGNKVGYARQLQELMTTDDLDRLNLRTWIKRLATAISEWNAVETS